MAAPQQDSSESAREGLDEPKVASKVTVEDAKPVAEHPKGNDDESGKQAPATAIGAKSAPGSVEGPPSLGENLTYAGTESSDLYLLAKRLLNDGDFDNAMMTLGEAMGTLTSLMPSESEAQLHESMGPLYYLYGTTLLYSIEESTDNLQASAVDENEADDSQIAWENLEAARSILDRMLSNDKTNEKLSLDLAQIHLRLGDLQRYNGRYHDAVTDYQSCLEIRQPILGVNNRKVADTHYNLGLVYLMLASEGDKKEQDAQPETPKISAQLREDYRRKGITHYLAAGKCFAGIVAFHCGVDSETITADAAGDEKSGGCKSTGMDQADLEFSNVSQTLAVIRDRVAPLRSSTDQAIIDDLKEILDEIQETIDEAHTSRQAISEVSEMKAQAKAAAEGDGEVMNADGSTTTIGFGPAPASIAAVAPGTASAAAAQPVMVVRKKKKRTEDLKELAAQEPDAKRAKSE